MFSKSSCLGALFIHLLFICCLLEAVERNFLTLISQNLGSIFWLIPVRGCGNVAGKLRQWWKTTAGINLSKQRTSIYRPSQYILHTPSSFPLCSFLHEKGWTDGRGAGDNPSHRQKRQESGLPSNHGMRRVDRGAAYDACCSVSHAFSPSTAPRRANRLPPRSR